MNENIWIAINALISIYLYQFPFKGDLGLLIAVLFVFIFFFGLILIKKGRQSIEMKENVSAY